MDVVATECTIFILASVEILLVEPYKTDKGMLWSESEDVSLVTSSRLMVAEGTGSKGIVVSGSITSETYAHLYVLHVFRPSFCKNYIKADTFNFLLGFRSVHVINS